MTTALDPYQRAARTVREAVRDKSYRSYPMGGEAGHYLRWKRGSLTKDSYRDYESCLDKLARYFPDLEIKDFEPPVGTERLEEFMQDRWGASEPRTWNKNRSIMADFFKWAVLTQRLHGDPTLALPRAKARDVMREHYSEETRDRIIESQDNPRDWLCCWLLLKRGLRKGALRSLQFKSFDHTTRRLTFVTKGGKVQTIPISNDDFWAKLDVYKLDWQAQPHEYLLNGRKTVFWKYDEQGNALTRVFERRDRPMGNHGAHDWWYACLRKAGIVAEGQTSGEKMHKSRHTAGQLLLDKTQGNIVAVKELLGHSDISTTEGHYASWDVDRLDLTLREVGE